MAEEKPYDEHEDTKAAIRTFKRYFESTNSVSIVTSNLEDNVALIGGNFCSRVLKLKFEYPKDHEIIQDSVLLKIPSLCQNYEAILKASIYDNEIYAYQHLLPALYKIWPGERLTPEFYTCTEAKVLILEDLTKSGFRARDKKDRLDLAHSRAALTVLAKFHATTVKYLQQLEARQEPLSQSLIEPIKAANLTDQAHHFHKFILELIKGRMSESVQQKVLEFEDKLLTASPYHINSEHNNLTVIAHGDFWTCNILFQCNGQGEVTAAKMVDWQITRRTSPVVDLIYLFVTGLQFEVFRDHQEELINLYLETLNEAFKMVDCSCTYSRLQFDQDMLTHRDLFLNLLINAVPMAMLEKETFFQDVKLASYSPIELIEFLIKWLTYLDTKGFL